MPGFIAVAGDDFLPFWITQDPAETVGILLHPDKRIGIRKLGKLRAGGSHIYG